MKFNAAFLLLLLLLPVTVQGQSTADEKSSKDELKKILETEYPDTSPMYIQALLNVPREPFIPDSFKSLAGANIDVPVLQDAITPSPLLVLRILNESGIRPGLSVLIVGKATGYLGAVTALITDNVTLLEFSDALYQSYTEILKTLDIDSVHVVNNIGGAAETGFMYDIVIIHGATPVLAPEISSFLRPSGVLIIPIAGKSGYQILLKIQYGNGLSLESLGETFFPVLNELNDFY